MTAGRQAGAGLWGPSAGTRSAIGSEESLRLLWKPPPRVWGGHETGREGHLGLGVGRSGFEFWLSLSVMPHRFLDLSQLPFPVYKNKDYTYAMDLWEGLNAKTSLNCLAWSLGLSKCLMRNSHETCGLSSSNSTCPPASWPGFVPGSVWAQGDRLLPHLAVWKLPKGRAHMHHLPAPVAPEGERQALEKKVMLPFRAPRGLCRGPETCRQVVGGGNLRPPWPPVVVSQGIKVPRELGVDRMCTQLSRWAVEPALPGPQALQCACTAGEAHEKGQLGAQRGSMG